MTIQKSHTSSDLHYFEWNEMETNINIDDFSLVLLPSLAMAVGVKPALFLQQVHYWSNQKHTQKLIEGRIWVSKSYKELQEHFPFWCERTIRRITERLQGLGILEAFIPKGFQKIKYYTINYDRLDETLSSRKSHISSTEEKSLPNFQNLSPLNL